MKRIFICLVLFSLMSCNQPNVELEKELIQTKAALQKAESKIIDLQSEGNQFFVHEVYFNIKDDLSEEEIQQFILALNEVSQIPVVKNLRIGRYKNMNDPKAMSDFEIIMSMSFSKKDDYELYQEHQVHLDLKLATQQFFDAAPKTYDYYIVKN